MALTDENGIGATMLVGPASVGNAGYPYPVYMNSGMGGGMGNGFGGDGWWVILLIILLAGGWNNGNGNGAFGGGNGYGTDFPWLMTGQQGINNNVSDGFRDVQLNDNVTSIRDGVNGLSTQLCNCCSDIQMSLANGFAGVEQGANTRQMANMQQAFTAQTAMMQGFNNVQSQFAECCCENRLANCQTQNIIQNEGNQTRFADANNTRDIIQSQTSGTQAILDKLCQLELDAKNDKISDLERQLTMANLSASQVAQTARLERSNSDTVDALYNRLATCPVGTMPVYGNQPIFTCPQQNNGCGCGCGSF